MNYINEKIKKGKKYKVSFCFCTDYNLAIYGHRKSGVFQTTKGMFSPPENFMVVEEIIVEPSEHNNHVREIITGLEIPVILTNSIRYNDDGKIGFITYGEKKCLAFAFALVRNFFVENNDYLLKETHSFEVEDYVKKHNSKNWYAMISNTILAGSELKQVYIKQRNEELKRQKEEILYQIENCLIKK